MENKICISSYNCRGLPKSYINMHLRPDLINVFSNSDIVCLQETWYTKQDLEISNTIMPSFVSVGVAKVDLAKCLLSGRPSGGVTTFYRQSLARCIKPITFPECDWCVGLEFDSGNKSFYLINVYLPYENDENEDEYE